MRCMRDAIREFLKFRGRFSTLINLHDNCDRWTHYTCLGLNEYEQYIEKLVIMKLWYESIFYIIITGKARKKAKRRVERERASLYHEGEALSFKHSNHYV